MKQQSHNVLTVLLLFLSSFYSRGQNLLPNGSLEDINICCENTAPCCPEGWFGYNYKGKQRILTSINPENLDGNHGMGIMINAGSERKVKGHLESCVFAPILVHLNENEWYTFSVDVRVTGTSIDQFHVLLTDTFFPDITLLQPTFTLKSNRGKYFKSSDTWQRVTFKFQATGTEKFLFLGQLIDCKNIKYKQGKNRYADAYLVIDNVSLTPDKPIEPSLLDSALNCWYAENRRHDFAITCPNSRNLFPNLLDKRFNDSLTTIIGILHRKPLVKLMESELSNCFFKLQYINDTALVPGNYPQFQPLLDLLKANKKLTIRLSGYLGEGYGTPTNAEELSLKHAIAVKRYFVANGIAAQRILVSGEGYFTPISYQKNENSNLVDDRVEYDLIK